VLEADRDRRSQLLISQYRHFIEQPDTLDAQLNRLIEVHGHDTIQAWRTLLTAGRFDELVQRLLGEHYDPTYDRSMNRNFTRLHEAEVFSLDPTQPAALDELATSLLTGVTTQS
jgi:tRNA 2-selenouridine synthase